MPAPSLFREAIKHVLNIEGGYVNDPADSGGETNHGVTLETARANGYIGPMKDMTIVDALRIAKTAFWDTMNLDTVAGFDYALALVMLRAGYHCGPGQASKWLQTALNAANNEQKLWKDISVDGGVGPHTIMALQAMNSRRGYEGMKVLRKAVNCQYGAFLTELTMKRQKDERFWYGWMKERID
jgi:lysozyme family protein